MSLINPCKYSFRDLIIASKCSINIEETLSILYTLPQKDINKYVKKYCERAKWFWEDRTGSDGIIYTAFSPVKELKAEIKMFDIILAVDKNRGIGLKGGLPWKIREELEVFRTKTQNSILITGRLTAETLPYLDGRTIFCVSTKLVNSSTWYTQNTVIFFETFETAVETALLTGKKIFVAGGAKLYNYVFEKYYNNIGTLHISFIKGDYSCDTFVNIDISKYYVMSKTKSQRFEHLEMKYIKHGEKQYLDLVKEVLKDGDERVGRNGKTLSLFGKHLKFDLREGFPLLTTKKMFTRGIIEELLFFLKGETDSSLLEKKNINIWKGNTSREFLDSIGQEPRQPGMMGPMYGYQWRFFNEEYSEQTGKPSSSICKVDQLSNVIEKIKNDPTSRRILMTAYNPAQAEQGVLYPCHSIIIQFYVHDTYLDMFCYNRSSDVGLGLPFNIASTSLLLGIIAKLTSLTPRYVNISLGDTHIYSGHTEALLEQTEREPFIPPNISIPNISTLEDINNMTAADFILTDYNHHGKVSMSMVS